MSYETDLEQLPWHFDLFDVLRRLERQHPDKPRIGDSSARAEDYVTLAQDPFLEFPASNIGRADHDLQGRLRLFVRFLGMLGPQGALPVTTTEEAFSWLLDRDDAFPRFLDVFSHRFRQLFFRAWADARPIAQHDRTEADRFHAYLGSLIGIGSVPYRDRDGIADLSKIAFAGLIAPRVKSASRLAGFIAGVFGIRSEVQQFVGSYLPIDPGERTSIGRKNSALGVDTMMGASFYSVQDKFRLRLYAKDLAEFELYLPVGPRAEQLTDVVFLYLGYEYDWDVELALPSGKIEPCRLGQAGRLGWTSWMAPNWSDTDTTYRADARFHLSNRRRLSDAA